MKSEGLARDESEFAKAKKSNLALKRDENRLLAKGLRESAAHLRDFPSEKKSKDAAQANIENELDYFKRNAFADSKDAEPYEFDK